MGEFTACLVDVCTCVWLLMNLESPTPFVALTRFLSDSCVLGCLNVRGSADVGGWVLALGLDLSCLISQLWLAVHVCRRSCTEYMLVGKSEGCMNLRWGTAFLECEVLAVHVDQLMR